MAYSNKVNVLHALANTLKRAKITSKVTVISRAKVPIVKFVTNFGRLNVDISVNQGNGVKAGQIINGFLKDMQGCGFALRCLIIIAKAFLNQRGMNEVYTGGVGSYSIVCLAVSFLQMHPKIRRGEIEAEKNLGVLVMEFFELYGSYFNYDEVGISVRDGGSYFSKRQRGWYDFMKGHLLSIEDPNDPSGWNSAGTRRCLTGTFLANDISKGSYGINKVRQTLAGAYGIMQAAAFMRAGILSSRREGRSYPLRKESNPEDMSILSSILGVTQEVSVMHPSTYYRLS
jgi:non-canonical poly(A) RNA polymerase PAPD5/7